MIGRHLGHYEVVEKLGEGGMGEVYRARDTVLDRDVALKVLSAALANDPERLARLTREARTLAALNHPHIAQIYGVEESALVMELVEGEDLSQRLARGRIPLDDALPIARQIAEALEAAHEKGIIHRDLKPSNVKVSLDGAIVKVLDFGLAKALSGGGSRSGDPSPSIATMTSPAMTAMGVILGTAAYMAPEQARGAPVDKRADIWAFGVVLFEMLTGRRLFDGGTVSDVLAAVLRQDIDLASLPADIPVAVATLLGRCLERDPKRRLRDIGEARVLLSGPMEAPRLDGAPPPSSRTRLGLAAPWVVAAVATMTAVLAFWRAPAPGPNYGSDTLRFAVTGPSSASGPAYTSDINLRPTLSPDGRMLALPLKSAEGDALFVRPLSSVDLIRIEGGGHLPFFSPDGRRLGFFRDSAVWVFDLTEQTAGFVGQVAEPRWNIGDSAWHPDGRLLIPGNTGLWSLPASGGEPTLLAPADTGKREWFTAVRVLEDGRLVVDIRMGSESRVEILSSDGRERQVAASGFERGSVVEDVLLSRHGGQWRATRFDLERLSTDGPSVPLSQVPERGPFGRSLAWVNGGAIVRELVWVSRQGAATPVGIGPAYFRWPRLSPDGTRVAVGRVLADVPAASMEDLVRIAVIDLRSGRQAQLDGFTEPVWLPDGDRVVTSTTSSGGLVEQVADGSRGVDALFAEIGESWPSSASADGRWLIYYGREQVAQEDPAGHGTDLFVFDRQTQERRRLPLAGAQRGGRLSPDGRWLAFQSTDNYRSEVHVRPFPEFDADYRISPDGGEEPAWSADGRELFYRRGLDMMRVQVPGADDPANWPSPERLFSGNFVSDPYGDQSYDVAPDGRFLMIRPVVTAPIDVQVVLDWLAEVRARLASAR